MKTKTHILLVALTTTVLSSGNAHALDFSAAKSFFNSAKTSLTKTANTISVYVEKNTLETRLSSEDTVKNAEKLLEIEKKNGNPTRIKSAEDLLKYAKTLHENNAKANDYATKAADATDTRVASELPTTNSSIIKLEGNIPQDSLWITLSISKESFKEVITIKVDDSKYEKNLPLRGGAGTYKINVFASSDALKPLSSFKFVREHKIVNTDSRDMSYLLPTEHAQSDNQEIIETAQRITSGAETDEEKISRIYQYITETVKYDYAAFNDGSFKNKPFDAVTVLENPIAFCSGYANLMAAISRAVGVKARVIIGKIERDGQRLGHAWNEVLVNGEWKTVDSTWDADRAERKYFFISKEQLAIDTLMVL